MLGLMGVDPAGLRDAIFASLPPRRIADELIASFRAECDWRWHVLHMPTFLDEYEQYWASSRDREWQRQIDPAWLAVYCMVISLGAMLLDPTRRMDMVESAILQTTEAPMQWHASSRLALLLSNWASRPQIRVVQTLLLFGPLFTHPGSPFLAQTTGSEPGDADQFSIWLAAAVRIARNLGIDQLGQSAVTMPCDDVAYPSGANSIKREVARRLWAFLVYLDRKTNEGTCLIEPGSCACGTIDVGSRWQADVLLQMIRLFPFDARMMRLAQP